MSNVNNDKNDILEDIRKVVREEMQRDRTSSPSSNVFARTHNLIRSATNNFITRGGPSSSLDVPSEREGRKRSVPGHPFRYTGNKKSKASSRSKMLTVILLPQYLEENESYKADSDNELLSGYAEIFPEYSEATIRKVLTNVFKTKLPFINDKDYEFVKRSKNVISRPTVPQDFEWGFGAIRALAGQGKLCCRLLVDERVLFDIDDNDSLFVQPVLSTATSTSSSTVQNSIQTFMTQSSTSSPSINSSSSTITRPPQQTSTKTSQSSTAQPPSSITTSQPQCSNTTTRPPCSTITTCTQSSPTTQPSSSLSSSSAPVISTSCQLSTQLPSFIQTSSPPTDTSISITDMTPSYQLINEHSYSVSETLIDLDCEPKEIHEVLVHQVNLKTDMYFEFKSDSIMNKELRVGIIGHSGKLEKGIGVGVTKEAISAFFEEFYVSCCVGSEELVPTLRHDMLKQEWVAVARIICFATTFNYFPVRLSKPFMTSAFLSEESITNEDLISSFLNHIPRDDKEVIESYQKKFKEDTDELLEILSSFNCQSLPTKETLPTILFQLAHKELVQTPRYVASCWHNIFKKVKFKESFSPGNLIHIYKSTIPTGRKVVALFKAENATEQEKYFLEHLKRFVKNLSTDDLLKFLRLSTGANVVTVETIDVSFNVLVGAGRRPIFRTCGPTLELPSTYTCYSELSEELQSILHSPKAAFAFNIA